MVIPYEVTSSISSTISKDFFKDYTIKTILYSTI